MNQRYLAYQALANNPYYGPKLLKLPYVARVFIVNEIEKTAKLTPDEFVVHVRNIFLDVPNKPTCWGTIDEILMACGVAK